MIGARIVSASIRARRAAARSGLSARCTPTSSSAYTTAGSTTRSSTLDPRRVDQAVSVRKAFDAYRRSTATSALVSTTSPIGWPAAGRTR